MVTINIGRKEAVFFGVVILVLAAVGFGVAVDPNIHGHPDAAGSPAGAITAFNLGDCPVGWVLANGDAGTPDLRGKFIRGLDMGAGVDSGRLLGSAQDDMLKSHDHDASTSNEGGSNEDYLLGGDDGIPTYNNIAIKNTGGSETRPKNVALIYCMKE